MIEDQRWPKRCGHMAGKSVIAAEDMEVKVRAAAGERMLPETFIWARTDARGPLGLDEALRRAERYLRAGADGLFVEAPRSVEELEIIGRSFDVPQLANRFEGGLSPVLKPAEYYNLGFRALGYGTNLIMRVTKTMQLALRDIRSGKFALMDTGVALEDISRLSGSSAGRRWKTATEGTPGPAECSGRATRTPGFPSAPVG
jgi:2-methylisocitrate lyase-like PEP mutase family enzyme